MNGIGQCQAVAAGLIAVGVIGEGGVDDAAGDRGRRMRKGLAGFQRTRSMFQRRRHWRQPSQKSHRLRLATDLYSQKFLCEMNINLLFLNHSFSRSGINSNINAFFSLKIFFLYKRSV